MKPSGFGIIELLKTIILPEAHAMNKSITQATQNDKQISKSIKRFFMRLPGIEFSRYTAKIHVRSLSNNIYSCSNYIRCCI